MLVSTAVPARRGAVGSATGDFRRAGRERLRRNADTRFDGSPWRGRHVGGRVISSDTRGRASREHALRRWRRGCPAGAGHPPAKGSAGTPGSVHAAPLGGRWTAISLGVALPRPSSGLPEDPTSSRIVLCLTLLRARFTERTGSLRPLVVSYTTVSPLPRTGVCGGLFSVALSRGLPRVGVTHRPALRSPDVPRHRNSRSGDATVLPARSPSQCTAHARVDSSPRTRMQPLSGQRTTSSGAVARIQDRSDSVSVTPLPSETFPRRRAAPTP